MTFVPVSGAREGSGEGVATCSQSAVGAAHGERAGFASADIAHLEFDQRLPAPHHARSRVTGIVVNTGRSGSTVTCTGSWASSPSASVSTSVTTPLQVVSARDRTV